MNHRSTSLDADSWLIPPHHDTPPPSSVCRLLGSICLWLRYLCNLIICTIFSGLLLMALELIKLKVLHWLSMGHLYLQQTPTPVNEDFRIKRNMENSGKYVSHHDGGEQEKLYMNTVRKRDWKGRSFPHSKWEILGLNVYPMLSWLIQGK